MLHIYISAKPLLKAINTLPKNNLKAKNIITSALGMDEYFRVSNHKNAKEIWDTLQVTHEVTTDVKRSRINLVNHKPLKP